jgi:hypothetical protein
MLGEPPHVPCSRGGGAGGGGGGRGGGGVGGGSTQRRARYTVRVGERSFAVGRIGVVPNMKMGSLCKPAGWEMGGGGGVAGWRVLQRAVVRKRQRWMIHWGGNGGVPRRETSGAGGVLHGTCGCSPIIYGGGGADYRVYTLSRMCACGGRWGVSRRNASLSLALLLGVNRRCLLKLPENGVEGAKRERERVGGNGSSGGEKPCVVYPTSSERM